MSELLPQAEARDMKLALTTWRARSCLESPVCWTHNATASGVPAKAVLSFCGERRGSEMSELLPQAEARDMKLAPTTWRARSCLEPPVCWTPEI